MTKESLTKLRHKQPITLFSSDTKLSTRIQFNKKEKDFVCWERWVKMAGGSWVNHNLYLSLKDVDGIMKQHSRKTI